MHSIRTYSSHVFPISRIWLGLCSVPPVVWDCFSILPHPISMLSYVRQTNQETIPKVVKVVPQTTCYWKPTSTITWDSDIPDSPALRSLLLSYMYVDKFQFKDPVKCLMNLYGHYMIAWIKTKRDNLGCSLSTKCSNLMTYKVSCSQQICQRQLTLFMQF